MEDTFMQDALGPIVFPSVSNEMTDTVMLAADQSRPSQTNRDHERAVGAYLQQLAQLQSGSSPSLLNKDTVDLVAQLLLVSNEDAKSVHAGNKQFNELFDAAARQLPAQTLPFPSHVYWTMRSLLLRCLSWAVHYTHDVDVAMQRKQPLEMDLRRVHPVVISDFAGTSQTWLTEFASRFYTECHRLLAPVHELSPLQRFAKMEEIVIQAQARIDWHTDATWRNQQRHRLDTFRLQLPHFHTTELKEWTRSRQLANEVEDDVQKVLGLHSPTAALAYESAVQEAEHHREDLAIEFQHQVPSLPRRIQLPEAWQQPYDPNLVRQTILSVHAGVRQMLTDPKQRPPTVVWSAERTSALVHALERVTCANTLARNLMALADVFVTWRLDYEQSSSSTTVKPPQIELPSNATSATKELLLAAGFAPLTDEVWESLHLTPDSLAHVLRTWQLAVVVAQTQQQQQQNAMLLHGEAQLVCRVYDHWVQQPFWTLVQQLHDALPFPPIPDASDVKEEEEDEKLIVSKAKDRERNVKRKPEELRADAGDAKHSDDDDGGVQSMTDEEIELPLVVKPPAAEPRRNVEFDEPPVGASKRSKFNAGGPSSSLGNVRKALFTGPRVSADQKLHRESILALHELNLALRISRQLALWHQMLEHEDGTARDFAIPLCRLALVSLSSTTISILAPEAIREDLEQLGFQITTTGMAVLNCGLHGNRLLFQRLVASALVYLDGNVPEEDAETRETKESEPVEPIVKMEDVKEEEKDAENTEMAVATSMRATNRTGGRISTQLRSVMVPEFQPDARLVDALVTFRRLLIGITPKDQKEHKAGSAGTPKPIDGDAYSTIFKELESKVGSKVPGLIEALKYLLLGPSRHAIVEGTGQKPYNATFEVGELIGQNHPQAWPRESVVDPKVTEPLFLRTDQTVPTQHNAMWVDQLSWLSNGGNGRFMLPDDHPDSKSGDAEAKSALRWRMNVDYALNGTQPVSMENKKRSQLAGKDRMEWSPAVDNLEKMQPLEIHEAQNIVALAYTFLRHALPKPLNEATAKMFAYAFVVRTDLWRKTIVREYYRKTDDGAQYRFLRTDQVVCLAAAIASQQPTMMLVADQNCEYIFVPPATANALDAAPPDSILVLESSSRQWRRYNNRAREQRIIKAAIEHVVAEPGFMSAKRVDKADGTDARRIELFRVANEVRREHTDSHETYRKRIEQRLWSFMGTYRHTIDETANLDVQSQLSTETFLDWTTRMWHAWFDQVFSDSTEPSNRNSQGRLLAGMGLAMSLIHIGQFEESQPPLSHPGPPTIPDFDVADRLWEWIQAYRDAIVHSAHHSLLDPLHQQLQQLKRGSLLTRLGQKKLWDDPQNRALLWTTLKVDVLDRFYGRALTDTRNHGQELRQDAELAQLLFHSVPLAVDGKRSSQAQSEAARHAANADQKQRNAQQFVDDRREQKNAEQWLNLLAIAYTYHHQSSMDVSFPLFQALDSTSSLQWQSVAAMEGCRDVIREQLRLDNEGKQDDNNNNNESWRVQLEPLARKALRKLEQRFRHEDSRVLVQWLQALAERPQDAELRAAMVRFATEAKEAQAMWAFAGERAYPPWNIDTQSGLRAAMTLDVLARVPGIQLDERGFMVRPLHVLLHGSNLGTLVLLLLFIVEQSGGQQQHLQTLGRLLQSQRVPWADATKHHQSQNGIARWQSYSTQAVFRTWLTNEVATRLKTAEQHSASHLLRRLAVRCGLSKSPLPTTSSSSVADIAKALQRTERQAKALAAFATEDTKVDQEVKHAVLSSEIERDQQWASAEAYVTWNQALSFRLLAAANELRRVFTSRACDAIVLHGLELNREQRRQEFVKLAKETVAGVRKELYQIRLDLERSTAQTLQPLVRNFQGNDSQAEAPAVLAASVCVFHLKQSLDALDDFVQWVDRIVSGSAYDWMRKLLQANDGKAPPPRDFPTNWSLADVLLVLHQQAHERRSGAPSSEHVRQWKDHLDKLGKASVKLSSSSSMGVDTLLDAGFRIDSFDAMSFIAPPPQPPRQRGDGKDAKEDTPVSQPAPISRLCGDVNRALGGFWRRANESKVISQLLFMGFKHSSTLPMMVATLEQDTKSREVTLARHTIEQSMQVFRDATNVATEHLKQLAQDNRASVAINLNLKHVLEHYVRDVTNVHAAKAQSFSYLAAFLSNQCSIVVKEIEQSHHAAIQVLQQTGWTFGNLLPWNRSQDARRRTNVRVAMSAYYVAVLKLQRIHRLIQQLLNDEVRATKEWTAFTEHVQHPIQQLRALMMTSPSSKVASAIATDFKRFAESAQDAIGTQGMQRMMDAIVREQGHLEHVDWGQAERKLFEVAWDKESSVMPTIQALRTIAMGHTQELTASIQVLERQQLNNQQLSEQLQAAASSAIGVCLKLIAAGIVLALPRGLSIPQTLTDAAIRHFHASNLSGIAQQMYHAYNAGQLKADFTKFATDIQAKFLAQLEELRQSESSFVDLPRIVMSNAATILSSWTSQAASFYEAAPNAQLQHMVWTAAVLGSLATYTGSVLQPIANHSAPYLPMALLGIKAFQSGHLTWDNTFLVCAAMYGLNWTGLLTAKHVGVFTPITSRLTRASRWFSDSILGNHLVVGTIAWGLSIWALDSQLGLRDAMMARYQQQSGGSSLSLNGLLQWHPMLAHVLQPSQTGLLAAFWASATGAVRVLDQLGQSAIEGMTNTLPSREHAPMVDIASEFDRDVQAAAGLVNYSRHHFYQLKDGAYICFWNQAPDAQTLKETSRQIVGGIKTAPSKSWFAERPVVRIFNLVLSQTSPNQLQPHGLVQSALSDASVVDVQTDSVPFHDRLQKFGSLKAWWETLESNDRDVCQAFINNNKLHTTDDFTKFSNEATTAMNQTPLTDMLKRFAPTDAELGTPPKVVDWPELLVSWNNSLVSRAAARALVPLVMMQLIKRLVRGLKQAEKNATKTKQVQTTIRDKLTGFIDLAVCCGITPVVLEDMFREHALTERLFGPSLEFIQTTLRGLGNYLLGNESKLSPFALERRAYWRNQWHEWKLSCCVDFVLPVSAATVAGWTTTQQLLALADSVQTHLVSSTSFGPYLAAYGGWCGIGLVSLFWFYRSEQAYATTTGKSIQLGRVLGLSMVTTLATKAALSGFALVPLVGGPVAISLAYILGRGAVKSWFRARHQQSDRPVAVSLEDLADERLLQFLPTAGRIFDVSVDSSQAAIAHPLDNRVAEWGHAPSGTATAALEWLLRGASTDLEIQHERDRWAAYVVHAQAEERASQATDGELPMHLVASKERVLTLAIVPMFAS
jgi:hypothetical protein